LFRGTVKINLGVSSLRGSPEKTGDKVHVAVSGLA